MGKKQEKTLVLIDGNYLMYRSFWGVRGLVTSKGLLVNAVFGFLISFRKLLDDLRPTKIAVVFDGKGKTWRHELVDKSIKEGITNRKYKDRTKVGLENFYVQLNIVKKFMKALRIRFYQKPCTESDDIIGTLVKKYDALGYKVLLFTKDKDFYQLLKYNVSMYKPDGIARKYYDKVDFKSQYNINPGQWCFAGALMGDGSDTIVGIKGIGEKGACLLVRTFGKLKNLYKSLRNGEFTHFRRCNLSISDIPRIKLNYKLKKLSDINDLKPIPKIRKVNRKLLKKLFRKYEMESLSVSQYVLSLEGKMC